MKLSYAVEDYVDGKHALGHRFERGETYLVALYRELGEVDLSEVRTQQVLAYLDSRVLMTSTWQLKYHVLFRFFDHWTSRGEMPELMMPPARPKVQQTFVPYVYSRAEIRALLKATLRDQASTRKVDHQTLRTFLLLLYGTGALVGEAITLRNDDLDLQQGAITIHGRSTSRSRTIPIGKDLLQVLKQYARWRSRRGTHSPFFLTSKSHQPLGCRNLGKAFERLRSIAGVHRDLRDTYQPRMHDLRYSFAVHRITSWILEKADLNRMLPALAAYMGQVGLGSTERYLKMTPERFRKELRKLSPDEAKRRWRDDKPLMEYLAGLQGTTTRLDQRPKKVS